MHPWRFFRYAHDRAIFSTKLERSGKLINPKKVKKFFAGSALVALALVTLAPLAHAAIPTAAEFATQVGSSTTDGSDYIAATVFSGGGLKFLIWTTVVGVLIGLVIMGISRIGFRKKV